MKTDPIIVILLLSIGMTLGIVFSCYLRGLKCNKTAVLRNFWAKLRNDSHYTSNEKDFFLTLVDHTKLKDIIRVSNSNTSTYGGANSPIFV